MNGDEGIVEESAIQDDRNVITIGELQIRRVRRTYFDAQQKCAHRHLETDDHGGTVQCRDCNAYVSPYWALTHFCEEINRGFERVRSAQQQAAWERKKLIRRVAARRIEEAWGRGMAPCCPHCHEGILPEDGLGASQENMRLLRARRERAQP